MARRSVILVADQVQDQEFWYPYYRLQEAGYHVEICAPSMNIVNGKYGIPIHPTCVFNNLPYMLPTLDKSDVIPIIIPGGWGCPEVLRMSNPVLNFLIEAVDSRCVPGEQPKVAIGAICHGPWVLASAGLVKDKRMTCYKGMKDDLINAGAKYEAADVVVDAPFVTAPHYKNNPEFMRELLKLCENV